MHPCVNKSEYLTTIYSKEVYMGFIHLKSLETKVAQQIDRERKQNGAYKSLNDFMRRIPVGLEQVRLLIRVGAFRFTAKSKQKLLWEAMLYHSNSKNRVNNMAELFDTEPKDYPLPVLQRNELEDAFDEIELLGFPLCNPFRLVATTDYGDTQALELLSNLEKNVHILGYVVTTKNTSTLKGELMQFGTFCDHQGEVFDTVHFPDVARRFPFRGRGFYSIRGEVVEDFGIPMIEVHTMEKIPLVNKKELPYEPLHPVQPKTAEAPSIRE
jgi:DNA polymerase III alpha subunit